MTPDYVELRPAPSLRRFVERFWIHRVTGPPAERRLLPDGRMHLVWIAELGLRVAGPAQAPMSHPRLPEMLAVGATFHPGAAPYLLRTPASELVDRRVHVDAIAERRAEQSRMAAKLHDPSRPVVAMVGDGGFAMTATEIRLAAALGLPMVVVVFVDGSLNRIELTQRSRGIPSTALERETARQEGRDIQLLPILQIVPDDDGDLRVEAHDFSRAPVFDKPRCSNAS